MFNSPRKDLLRCIIDKLGITKPPISLATLSSDELDKNIPVHHAQLLAMKENLDADNHVIKQQVRIIGNNLPELMCFINVEFSFTDKLWLVHMTATTFPPLRRYGFQQASQTIPSASFRNVLFNNQTTK